jgi:transposase-like protein
MGIGWDWLLFVWYLCGAVAIWVDIVIYEWAGVVRVAQGKAHSEEVRSAVLAALLAGQGVSEIAARYSISDRVVRRWREGHLAEVVRESRERGEGLCLQYLSENLACLRAQLVVAGNGEYLKGQPAAELATLHGVVADRAFKILEALGRGDDEA